MVPADAREAELQQTTDCPLVGVSPQARRQRRFPISLPNGHQRLGLVPPPPVHSLEVDMVSLPQPVLAVPHRGQCREPTMALLVVRPLFLQRLPGPDELHPYLRPLPSPALTLLRPRVPRAFRPLRQSEELRSKLSYASRSVLVC